MGSKSPQPASCASTVPHDPSRHVFTRSDLQILVVDDSRDAAFSLSMILSGMGYRTEAAVGGHEALRKAQQKRPHVVLMDLAMPMLDGFDTARELRLLPGVEQVFIIALTGWNRPEDFERTSQAGFYAHLVKPATIVDVMKVLDEIGEHLAGGSEASSS